MPTLQREVSWRWRPPSISLMDWKRFTRKSSKPGGRGFENDDARGGHTHMRWPAGNELSRCEGTSRTSCLCASPHRPRSAVWQQQDCPNGFGCNHTALMVLWPVKRRAGRGGVIYFFEWAEGGNLLFKDSKVSQRGKKKMWERKIHLYLKLLKQ